MSHRKTAIDDCHDGKPAKHGCSSCGKDKAKIISFFQGLDDREDSQDCDESENNH